MRLRELADVSNRVAATPSRLAKTAILAGLIKQLSEREIQVGVAYLAGSLPQGRIGLGWSAMARARTVPPAEESTIDLIEADSVFEGIAGTKGAGTAQARAARLAALFARATAVEQEFLI